MAEDQAQEKTHEPTEKRKQEFREKGQVPRSREVLCTLGLAIGVASMILGLSRLGVALGDVFLNIFAHMNDPDLDHASTLNLGAYLSKMIMYAIAVPLGLSWFGVALVGLVQGRGSIPKEGIKVEWDKLNPINGFKQQYMSSRALVELAKGVIKLLLIGYLVLVAIQDRPGLFPGLMYQSPTGILVTFQEVGMLVISRALPVGAVIAVLDYLFEWYQLNEQMMMTREEVKDEQKDSDGDPHMRAARRQRMRQIAMSKTIQQVAQADVIVTNPTHYAVALRYRKGEAPAPVIMAKGVDHLALRMRAEATRHDIPTVENRTLARALYAQGKEGQMIPEDLYAAVAQVLAVIWRRHGRRPGSRPGRTGRPSSRPRPTN